jgi:predicted DNA binding CopG/RHH family protein
MFVMTKPWPALRSDAEAERFAADADLTDCDFLQMVPMAFENTGSDRQVAIRLPAGLLLDAVEAMAKTRGIPYQRLIREVLEWEIQRSGKAQRGEPQPAEPSSAAIMPARIGATVGRRCIATLSRIAENDSWSLLIGSSCCSRGIVSISSKVRG